MKALHIITGLGVGGAEQQLRLLLRHLPVHCDVVTLTNPGPVAEGLRADGVSVAHLAMNGNRDLAALPRLARLIRRGRYDLVHTHLYRACVYGRIAARMAGVRTTIATEHSLGERQIEGRPLTRGIRALYLRTEKLGSATVAVSATIADRLRTWGVPAQRIHLVPNGIDAESLRFDQGTRLTTRAQLSIPAGAFVVGGVGRLVPGKRFELLVRAVAAIPDARLVLAGDGPERTALRTLARRLGAADRIRFLGECDALGDGPDRGVPAIPAVLSALDIFVSASEEESFGLAAVEALAAGLPVLHVSCPAIEDLPAALAPGAVRVAGRADALEAALRIQMSTEARRLQPPPVVSHYDIVRSARSLLDVYARAVASTPSTDPTKK
ncbi:glycosyltransferase [Streptomyces himalayensis]|uniref:D-inositol 3-phosphate glycosyltransferase n=1 Tax=Streptomyces himalayensis subsp. himalayensis TaxID=2756131 RepID=A0A7W0ID90_9ACTN|nr:glycosyltransferase [Streptomyces himalayensis]MBA2951530.1 glycosyltransferase [Streptomyces himalayensis subsp. himalayensis]